MNENEKLEAEQEAQEKSNPQSDLLMGLRYLNKAYLWIVISCATIAALGIFIAIQFVLWIGVAVAFVSALCYMIFSKLILKKFLGMSYESTSGAITITKVSAKEQAEVFIPRRIFWVNVTCLGDKAFAGEHAKNLQAVHIPATVTEIGENVFEGCDALKAVYFEGTAEAWEQIESATSFDGLELIFCDTALYELPKKNKAKEEPEIGKTDEAPSDTEENV